MPYRVVSNFTEFSDDILLHIFSFLSSTDLLNILETCERLNKVGKDHSLWKYVDFSDGHLTATHLNRRVIPCLHSCTKYLHVRGQKRKKNAPHKWKMDLLTPSIMSKIGQKCPNLTRFCVSDAVVDAKKFKIVNFGELKELEELSIIGCEFINLPIPSTEGSYFRYIQNILPKLKSLEISRCNWITDYDLMVLSKLDSLKRLIIKSDLRIGYTIAYLSISFRFGFKNLEELDMRGTSLLEADVPSIVQGDKLKSLSLGPIGRVKRLNGEHDDGLNLVMSDPHRREESRHQVVVINMGPNGPNWRQANDEELDRMGLQWVRNGLNQARNNEKDEEHYFFGKEGKIVKNTENSSGECGECSRVRERREKRKHQGPGKDGDGESSSPKRQRVDTEHDTSASEDETEETEPKNDEIAQPIDNENPSGDEEEEERDSNLPDKFLSDYMVAAFENHSKHLQNLVLAGCAITDEGFLKLVRYIPTLRYFDVSETYVTPEGIQKAKAISPGCNFVVNSSSCKGR